MANHKGKVNKFDDMRWGWIIGVVDAYDAVHSVFVGLHSDESRFHEDHFPMQSHKRWRWCFSDCFSKSVLGEPLTEEDYDRIMIHITKKYGIKFWDNGHHDIDHFISKISKSER